MQHLYYRYYCIVSNLFYKKYANLIAIRKKFLKNIKHLPVVLHRLADKTWTCVPLDINNINTLFKYRFLQRQIA